MAACPTSSTTRPRNKSGDARRRGHRGVAAIGVFFAAATGGRLGSAKRQSPNSFQTRRARGTEYAPSMRRKVPIALQFSRQSSQRARTQIPLVHCIVSVSPRTEFADSSMIAPASMSKERFMGSSPDRSFWKRMIVAPVSSPDKWQGCPGNLPIHREWFIAKGCVPARVLDLDSRSSKRMIHAESRRRGGLPTAFGRHRPRSCSAFNFDTKQISPGWPAVAGHDDRGARSEGSRIRDLAGNFV